MADEIFYKDGVAIVKNLQVKYIETVEGKNRFLVSNLDTEDFIVEIPEDELIYKKEEDNGGDVLIWIVRQIKKYLCPNCGVLPS